MSGSISLIVISICSIFFIKQAYTLYKEQTVEAARKLMFGSFFYLPLVQLAVMFGK
jgi:protoheme IX farnesyltransferase